MSANHQLSDERLNEVFIEHSAWLELSCRVMAAERFRAAVRLLLAEALAATPPTPAREGPTEGEQMVGEPFAWGHPDGRVVPSSTKRQGDIDGGATKSSLAGYTIPLYAISPPQGESFAATPPAVEGEREAFERGNDELIASSLCTMRALSACRDHEPNSLFYREAGRAIVAIELLCAALAARPAEKQG